MQHNPNNGKQGKVNRTSYLDGYPSQDKLH